MNAESSEQLRARIILRIGRERAPTRAELAAQRRLVVVGLLVAPLVVFLGAGGVRAAPRPDRLVLATTLGSAVLAIGAALLGLDRGRSMLGPPRLRLVLVAVITPFLLFAWRVLASSRHSGMMAASPERPGVRCLFLSGALVLAPLLGLLWVRRHSDPVHPRASAAALGAAAGAGAWVFVDAWCPVSYVPHLLLGHVLPLVLTIVASACFGHRALMLRAQVSDARDASRIT
jgi:hypothetical protein